MLRNICCETAYGQQNYSINSPVRNIFVLARGGAKQKAYFFVIFLLFSKAFPIAKNHFTNIKMPSEIFCNYFRREICQKESKIECCQIDNIFFPRPKNFVSTCVPQQKSDPVILRRRNICCPTGYCRSRQQKNGCAQQIFLLRKQKHEV